MKPCPNLDCENWYAGQSPFGCRKCQRNESWLSSVGRCGKCRTPWRAGGVRCDVCKKNAAAVCLRIRAERKMVRACLDCTALAIKGQSRCLPHKLRHARYARRQRGKP